MIASEAAHRERFADVAVGTDWGQSGRTYHYTIPDHLSIGVGSLVIVPFGSRRLSGVVIALADSSPVSETRPIESLVDDRVALTPNQIALARWISERYAAPLIRVLALAAPPGMSRAPNERLSVRSDDSRLAGMVVDSDIVEALRRGNATTASLRREFGRARSTRATRALEHAGLLGRRAIPPPGQRRPTGIGFVRATSGDAASATRISVRQRDVLAFLESRPGEAIAASLVQAECGVDAALIRRLASRGLIAVDESAPKVSPRRERGPALTRAQRDAARTLTTTLDTDRSSLLFGVTASGKTEVYMAVIDAAIARGQCALVLAPEIALTPQMAHRYGARYPGRVLVIHSRLRVADRSAAWRRIREGAVDVVIGARSALFAPFLNLGVVVVDEEHEPSYKSPHSPRYHAREAALELGRIAHVPVILGSATPDLETWDRAWSGRHGLVEMPYRARGALPSSATVEIVDMRQAVRTGDDPYLSRQLVAAVRETVSRGEQAILFLNRRGSATLTLCGACGFVPRCGRCDVALTYHAVDEQMVCHHCNHRSRAYQACPACGAREIRFLGAGTQRIAADIARLVPDARVGRWDGDVARQPGAADAMTRAMIDRHLDILVGTQSIAKGLDLPGVVLVGIVSADTILHLPDPRATERTFQLIAQVSGRAGRRNTPGRVIVQTYSPENATIRFAAAGDYRQFATIENAFRRERRYPPFAVLARAIYAGSGAASARASAARMEARMRALIVERAWTTTDIVGVAPCFFARVRGRFRWHILLRGPEAAVVAAIAGGTPGWSVDVDPVSLL
ncbi:MAG: primosomal protein N' [Chloroflexota bacterium]|nr:MAG: primosomal protein N' [Chloroflexota bacterium]